MRVGSHGTSEMHAGRVVVARGRIATANVNVLGQHWTHVGNWMLENRCNLVPYAAVDTMSSCVIVHSVV